MINITDTLAERRKTHGSFSTNAEISQKLKDVIQHTTGWGKLTHVQREALDMICGKVGRILAGNPHEPDHWHDIAGYSELAHEEARQTQSV